MKKIFVSSCWFNYNLSTGARIAGFGRTKLRRLIKLYLELGWCKIEHGNLYFNNLNKNWRKVTLPCDHTSIKAIRQTLNFAILQNIERRQKYIQKKKADLQNPVDHKAYKSAIRSGRKYGFINQEAGSPSFDISLKRLAWHFNMSKSWVANKINELKKGKFLSVQKNIYLVAENVTEKMFEYIRTTVKGYCFYGNGLVIGVYPSTYTLLPPPPSLTGKFFQKINNGL